MRVLLKEPEMLSCWRPSGPSEAAHLATSSTHNGALCYPPGSLLGGRWAQGIDVGPSQRGQGSDLEKLSLVSNMPIF